MLPAPPGTDAPWSPRPATCRTGGRSPPAWPPPWRRWTRPPRRSTSITRRGRHRRPQDHHVGRVRHRHVVRPAPARRAHQDPARARHWLEQALRLAARWTDPRQRVLSTVFYEQGVALLDSRAGEPARALRLIDDGLARLTAVLAPGERPQDLARLRHNRAQVYLALGDPARALTELDTVIAHDPDNCEYYVDRAALHRAAGRRRAAIRDHGSAIRLGTAPAGGVLQPGGAAPGTGPHRAGPGRPGTGARHRPRAPRRPDRPGQPALRPGRARRRRGGGAGRAGAGPGRAGPAVHPRADPLGARRPRPRPRSCSVGRWPAIRSWSRRGRTGPPSGSNGVRWPPPWPTWTGRSRCRRHRCPATTGAPRWPAGPVGRGGPGLRRRARPPDLDRSLRRDLRTALARCRRRTS